MTRKCLVLVLAAALVGIGGVSESGIFTSKSGFRVVTLRELVEAPESYVDVSVSFRARYKQTERDYRVFHTSYTSTTHAVFSVWPEDAWLWEARGRAGAVPYVFVSKKSRCFGAVEALSKYQIVTVSGTVKTVSRGLPCIEVANVSSGPAPLIDDALIESFQLAVDSVETNPKFAMDKLTEILSKKLPPLFEAGARKYIARCHLIRGENRKAIEGFAEASVVLKEDAELFLWKAISEGKVGANAAADISIRRSLELNPDDAYALSVNGVILEKQGKHEEAVAQCKKALELSEGNPAIYWNYGKILVDQRRYGEAAAVLEKARELKRNDARIAKKLGFVYIMLGKLGDATERYAEATKIAPRDGEAHFGLAGAYAMAEKWTEAKAEYLKAISLNPENEEYHLALARLHLRRDEFLAAADRFRKVLDLNPGCTEAHLQLGLIAERDSRWQDALKSFLEVVKLNPGHEKGHRHLVACYGALGNTDKIIWAMEKVVALAPNDHEIRFALGKVYKEEGNYKASISHLAVCVEQQPTNVDYRMTLALVQQLDNKVQDAEASYKQVLKLNPDSALACNNLAYMYLEQGRKDDATLALAKKAHELDPGNPAFLDTMGWALYVCGKADEAWEYIDASYRAEPSPEVAYHLGMVLAKLDRLEEAERLLQESLKQKGPWNRDARRTLATIVKSRKRKEAAARKGAAKVEKPPRKLVKPEKRPVIAPPKKVSKKPVKRPVVREVRPRKRIEKPSRGDLEIDQSKQKEGRGAAARKPRKRTADKAAEKKAAEKRAAEKRAAEQRAAEKRAAEKRAAEKRAAEKKAAEKRAAEKRAAEKKAAEKRAAEKRAAEKKAAEKRAAEKKAAEKRAAEKRAAEKKAAEKKAAEKRAAEKRAAEKKAAEKRAAEKRAAAARKKAAKKEMVRVETKPREGLDLAPKKKERRGAATEKPKKRAPVRRQPVRKETKPREKVGRREKTVEDVDVAAKKKERRGAATEKPKKRAPVRRQPVRKETKPREKVGRREKTVEDVDVAAKKKERRGAATEKPKKRAPAKRKVTVSLEPGKKVGRSEKTATDLDLGPIKKEERRGAALRGPRSKAPAKKAPPQKKPVKKKAETKRETSRPGREIIGTGLDLRPFEHSHRGERR